MGFIKKLAGQTAVYGLSSIVGRFLNYLLVPLYTRLFAPQEYGIVTELYAYAGFLAIILIYGMETSFFRYGRENRQLNISYSTALGSVFSSTVLICFFILVFSSDISNAIGYSGLEIYIIFFALICGLDSITALPFALLRLQGKAMRFAFVRLSNIFVNLGLNLFFLLLLPGLAENYLFFESIYFENFGVGYIFLSNLIASVVSLLLLIPEIMKVRSLPDFSLLRKMFVYAWPIMIIGLAGVVNEMFGRVIMKHLLTGSEEQNMTSLGIYGAVYKLAMLVALFIQAYRYAAEPFFFSQALKRSAKSDFAHLMHFFIFICGSIFLIVALYIDIFKYFIGERYHEGLFIVPVLLMANIWLGIYYNLSIWYKLSDKTHLGAYVAIAGAFITIVLNIWWVPVFGYAGSAWATLGCYFGMSLISYFFGKQFYHVNYNLLLVFKLLGLSVALYFIAYFFTFPIENLVFKTLLNTLLLLLYFAGGYFTLKKDLPLGFKK
ncbi:MAG: polysaccharide biosynthesis protein [Chitinophagaceae bacterium]|nr:MAG: polysaccharide biosynthesis protein [Chitinophagaceae bacterium]